MEPSRSKEAGPEASTGTPSAILDAGIALSSQIKKPPDFNFFFKSVCNTDDFLLFFLNS